MNLDMRLSAGFLLIIVAAVLSLAKVIDANAAGSVILIMLSWILGVITNGNGKPPPSGGGTSNERQAPPV